MRKELFSAERDEGIHSRSPPARQQASEQAGGRQRHERDKIAREIDGGDADPFYSAKIVTARFFADHQMSRAPGLASTVMDGAAGALLLDESLF